MRLSLRFGLTLASQLLAGGAAHAAAPTEGAFANSFQDGKVACFSKAAFAELRADAWQKRMTKRGKDCQISESDSPLATIRRWKASCTDERGSVHRYKFSVTLPGITGNTLVIDSKISDQAGNDKAANVFFGEYRGACTAETPAFAMWNYFDLPDRRALESVARDLLYCGALYSGLSLAVTPSKRDAVATLGSSLTTAAAAVLPDDMEFLKRELEPASNRAAADIVGANADKLLQLSQSAECKPYLEQGGIDNTIRQRNAGFNQ